MNVSDDDQIYPAKDRTDIGLQKQYSPLLLTSTRVLNTVYGASTEGNKFLAHVRAAVCTYET